MERNSRSEYIIYKLMFCVSNLCNLLYGEIADFLQPLKEITDIMSAHKYPTLSLVIPLFNSVVDHFEEVLNKHSHKKQPPNTVSSWRFERLCSMYTSVVFRFPFILLGPPGLRSSGSNRQAAQILQQDKHLLLHCYST